MYTPNMLFCVQNVVVLNTPTMMYTQASVFTICHLAVFGYALAPSLFVKFATIVIFPSVKHEYIVNHVYSVSSCSSVLKMPWF